MPSKLGNLLLMGGFVIGGYLVFSPYIAQPTASQGVNEMEGLATVIIEKDTTAVFRVPIRDGERVEETLGHLTDLFEIPVELKSSDYGPYIYSINNTPAEDSDRWVYYVNDTAPTVGIDQTTIKTGDIVTFKFQTYKDSVTSSD